MGLRDCANAERRSDAESTDTNAKGTGGPAGKRLKARAGRGNTWRGRRGDRTAIHPGENAAGRCGSGDEHGPFNRVAARGRNTGKGTPGGGEARAVRGFLQEYPAGDYLFLKNSLIIVQKKSKRALFS